MQVTRFLLKICVLSLLLVSTYLFFARKLTEGFVADDYSKFTHQAPNLIIGLSREHYGLDPETIQRELQDVFSGIYLNFAFEKSQSPYGEVYHNAIQKKIPSDTSSGLFILGVSPGSFSASNRLSDDKAIFDFDSKMMIGKIENLNTHPNLEFVRKAFGRSLYKGIWPHDHRITTVFHDNGWEEFKLKVPEYQANPEDLIFWKRETIEGYTALSKVLPERISEYRLRWFENTIRSLKKKGTVVMVRMPMHPGVGNLEEQVWPEFDNQMVDIANNWGVPYFNYASTGETFETYDGSHLYSESARAFSKFFADEIENYRRNHMAETPVVRSVTETQEAGY